MVKFHRVLFIALCLLGLTLGIATSSAPAFADTPMVHVVSWGDTLFSIANRYGTTMQAIMQANGIRNANFIYVGQRLTIPGGSPAPLPGSAGGTYVVQAGDTLFSIAMRNGTTVNALMQANGLYNYWIYVGQTLRLPGQPVPAPVPPAPNPGVYHIVRPGEWLEFIAARYGTSVYAIQIANKLPNPSFIWVGQRLFIPGGVLPQHPIPIYNPLPPIYTPPSNPPVVILPPQNTPVPVVILPSSSASSSVASVPNPFTGTWQATLLSNTTGNGPCSLGVFVRNRSNWPVVVATPDGTWISDPKTTGDKPERGSDYVEFAHACTGVWRVIPLGLNIYADVQLNGGHAEVEFRQR
jgi:LysM repeat protein